MASIALIRRSFRVDGGAERAINSYLDYYVEAGHKVTLVCETWYGALPPGVQVITLKLTGGRLAKLWLFWFKVKSILAENDFDWVQSHEWIESVEVLRLGDGLHSVWLNTLIKERVGLKKWLSQISLFHLSKCWMERRSLNSPQLRKVIVNSNLVAGQVERSYPLVSERVTVHRNVVDWDFDMFSRDIREPVDGSIRLMFVGSGWSRKGLRQTLAVLDLLKYKRPCTLDVYGTDKKSKIYVQEVRSKRLDDLVRFCGIVPLTGEIYSDYDILILPSLYDPFPNVVAEALCAGLTIVTTSATGCVDYRDSSQVFIADSQEEMLSCLISYSRPTLVSFETLQFRKIFSKLAFRASLSRDGLC